MAKRILIVDDEPRYLRLLEANLRTEGYEVATAQDGVQALDVFSAQPIDLVLLDVMMPRLDGFGVIEQLRQNPETRDLPVIVISAKELTDEEAKKLKESVTFVMKKQGFDGERLVREISTALEK